MAHLIFWNNAVSIKGGDKGFYSRPPALHQAKFWVEKFGYTVKVLDFTNMMTTEELVKCTEKFIDKDTVGILVSSNFPFYWPDSNPYEPLWVQHARKVLEDKHTNIEWILTGTGVAPSWRTGRGIGNFVFKWTKIFNNLEDSLVTLLTKSKSNEKFHISKLGPYLRDDDFITPNEVLLTELARGCQYSCKFCNYPDLGKKKNTYLRDFSHVRDEFIMNYEKYGITKYAFCDSTFNESEEKLEQLAKLVSDLPFRLEYVAYNRLDLIGTMPGQAELLKASGLRSAFFGIESFNLTAGRAVGKAWNAINAKEWLLKLKNEIWKDEVNFHLSFIIGLPGETRKDIEQTIKWCQDNNMPSFDMRSLILDIGLPLKIQNPIELEYSKYGYGFPLPANTRLWKNKDWTQQTADKYSLHVGKNINDNNMLSMWNLAAVASLGYSYKELLWVKQKDSCLNTYDELAETYVKKYIDNILSL